MPAQGLSADQKKKIDDLRREAASWESERRKIATSIKDIRKGTLDEVDREDLEIMEKKKYECDVKHRKAKAEVSVLTAEYTGENTNPRDRSDFKFATAELKLIEMVEKKARPDDIEAQKREVARLKQENEILR